MDVRYAWFRYYAFIIINNNNNKYIFLEFSSYLITNSVFQIKVKTQGKHTGRKRTTFDGINGEATGYEASSEDFYFFSPTNKITKHVVFRNFFRSSFTLYSSHFSQHCLPWETPADNGAVMTLIDSW